VLLAPAAAAAAVVVAASPAAVCTCRRCIRSLCVCASAPGCWQSLKLRQAVLCSCRGCLCWRVGGATRRRSSQAVRQRVTSSGRAARAAAAEALLAAAWLQRCAMLAVCAGAGAIARGHRGEALIARACESIASPCAPRASSRRQGCVESDRVPGCWQVQWGVCAIGTREDPPVAPQPP
jgi:hypothetical protein